jgi:MFS family permease
MSAALTKILAGIMADFWDKRILLFSSAIFLSLALAILFAFSSYAAILAAYCMAAIALGGVLPTSASMLAARFGAPRLGSVMGWTYVLIFGSGIAAVRFTGTVFDLTGGYHIAFVSLLGTSLFIWIFALFMDTRLLFKP